MIECSWKSTFGVECLTCGFQRSFALLLDGDLVGSFSMFPATIPIILTFVLLLLHLKFRFRHGARYILSSFSVAAALILVNFSVKIAEGHFFH